MLNTSEMVTKWNDNPAGLVKRINSREDCFHYTRQLDSQFFPVRILSANLKYGKFVHLNVGGGQIPIFEGVDKIEFRNAFTPKQVADKKITALKKQIKKIRQNIT